MDSFTEHGLWPSDRLENPWLKRSEISPWEKMPSSFGRMGGTVASNRAILFPSPRSNELLITWDDGMRVALQHFSLLPEGSKVWVLGNQSGKGCVHEVKDVMYGKDAQAIIQKDRQNKDKDARLYSVTVVNKQRVLRCDYLSAHSTYLAGLLFRIDERGALVGFADNTIAHVSFKSQKNSAENPAQIKERLLNAHAAHQQVSIQWDRGKKSWKIDIFNPPPSRIVRPDNRSSSQMENAEPPLIADIFDRFPEFAALTAAQEALEKRSQDRKNRGR